MAKRLSCKSPGVRFRLHSTRKHGVNKDRYFSIRYAVDGKHVEEGLGWASQGWTEKKAAGVRAELLENQRRGEGARTLTEKRALDDADRRAKAPTVEEVLEEFWEIELSTKKAGKNTLRLLKKDILPAWGKHRVVDIKRRDIVLLLDTIRERAPITANRVHGALGRMFNFAAERGIIEDTPATRIRKPKEKPRSRVLTDDEIKIIWPSLSPEDKAIDAYPNTKLALKVLLLTGQRPGEVSAMKWDELDLDTGIWNNPAGKRGEEEPVSVPLTCMALEVIEEARTYSNESPFVFSSSYKTAKPITRASLARAINRHWKELGLAEPFTPHDLRRTLRTRLAELGVSDIVAERVVGHKLQGMLAVYNHHNYEVEKRQALEKWESKLRQIVGLDEPQAAKVIELKR